MSPSWARCQEYKVKRTVSTFQDVQKNLSLAMKAISKGESKKVLSNVNNYDSNKRIFFQSNYLKVIPLFDG